jgi:hypothetical protein
MMRMFCIFLLLISSELCAQSAEWEKDDFEELMGCNTSHWHHVHQPKDRMTLEFVKSLYEKNKHFQFSTESDFKIPPIVHFIWLGPKPFPSQSVENVRTWMAKNPNWEVKFWTDRQREPPCNGMKMILVDDFAFTKLGRCYATSENWGEKSDLLRYEILFQEGGVYVDHDANCLRSFDGLHRGYDFYCCLETPHEPFVGLNITCGNGVIGARAHHPAVSQVIDTIAQRWDAIGTKFRGKDEYSRIEVVMQRTYIALTDAIQKAVGRPGNTDIIFPSAYFFSKKGIPSIYSHHFYASAWDDFKFHQSSIDKIEKKSLNKIEHGTSHLMQIIIVVLSGNLIVLLLCLFQLKRMTKTC